MGEVETLWDVMHFDAPVVDDVVYLLWIQGYNASEATAKRQSNSPHIAAPFINTQDTQYSKRKINEFIQRDTINQYNYFLELLPYLQQPWLLMSKNRFQLPAQVKLKLIRLFFAFDSEVVREFMGKKLTSSLRKDLDDVSEKTKVPLPSCRRQFDNLKRVMKCALDSTDPEKLQSSHQSRTIYEVVSNDFFFPDELVRSYIHMIFLCHYRIDVHKKRMLVLTYENLDYLVGLILQQWAIPNSVQLDPKFVEMMRDLKSVMLSDRDILDEFRSLIQAHFNDPSSQLSSSTQLWRRLEKQFNTLIKSLLTIGAGLSAATEIRDLFLDVTDKVVSECIKLEMSQEDIVHFFMLLNFAFNDLKTVNSRYRQNYAQQWKRFLNGIQAFLLNVYQNMEGERLSSPSTTIYPRRTNTG